jgi:septal ring factor EnvC (AmiA/AmiB activator)
MYFPEFCVAIACFAALVGCENKNTAHTEFTKADSLTETYLALQDTMLQVWNTMIHDDNRKIKAMHHLLHELNVSRPEKREELEDYKERLDDLLEMRYDQQSMSDVELVSEYDFASNSLVSELIAVTESQKEFAYNTTLQNLVDSIRAADQRVNNYRQEYDDIALRFNRFVERNRNTLEEIEKDSTILKKPLFQMAAE